MGQFVNKSSSVNSSQCVRHDVAHGLDRRRCGRFDARLHKTTSSFVSAWMTRCNMALRHDNLVSSSGSRSSSAVQLEEILKSKFFVSTYQFKFYKPFGNQHNAKWSNCPARCPVPWSRDGRLQQAFFAAALSWQKSPYESSRLCWRQRAAVVSHFAAPFMLRSKAVVALRYIVKPQAICDQL
jgi:hypothetical protein